MSAKAKIATIGMFDGVHRGHLSLLARLNEDARRLGATTTVFTFDRHPLSLIAPDRAPAALMSLDDKVAALHNAGAESVVVLPFDTALQSLTARDFLKKLHDDYGITVILMGFNHRFGSDRLDDLTEYEKIGRKIGVEIIRADELRDADIDHCTISSSSIREAINKGDVAMAATMLGRPFSLRGKIVHGKQLGRTLGFPTANIEPLDPSIIEPAGGVYAVDVHLPGGGLRRGMLNIGRRPTVDSSAKPLKTIEVYIDDWHGDIYSEQIRIDFLKRLRDERRFANVDALREQLAADLEQARSERL